jgi:hypothetical protein
MADDATVWMTVIKVLDAARSEIEKSPIETVAGLFAIFIGTAALTKTGRHFFGNVYSYILKFHQRSFPLQTIRIVENPHDASWQIAGTKQVSGMYVHAGVFVTNITTQPIKVLATYLESKNAPGTVFVKHPTQNMYGIYTIEPGATSHATLSYWVKSSKSNRQSDFSSRLILVDQFGNRVRSKKILFVNREKSVSEAKSEIEPESIFKITNQTEKRVASILKDEINRYRIFGRTAGGLGSTYTVIHGEIHKSIPSYGWIPDSHKSQQLESNPATVEIKSDNFDAAIAFYEAIASTGDRTVFVEAFLSRLRKDCEYSVVGYFILLVLFRLGFLKEVLQQANVGLKGDTEYGFSDLLRMLEGLLRYKHTDFSDVELDQIEAFLRNINEYDFDIDKRVNAIRSLRVSGAPGSKVS